MGYYMRENGFYYVRIQRDKHTIRFSTKTKDPELAKQIYQDFLKELALTRIPATVHQIPEGVEVSAPDLVQPPPEDFQPAFTEYLQTCEAKGYARHTITMKKYLRDRLAAVGVSSMAHINQDVVNRFVTALTGSSDYKQEAMKQLKAFLNFCIKKGTFSRETYSRIEFPRFKKMRRETVITPEDFQIILDHLGEKGDHDFQFYLKTLYETVCRPAEATGLKVSDFDFASGSVSVMMNKTKQTKRAFLREAYLKDLREYIEKHGITGNLFAGNGRSAEFYQNKFSKVRQRLKLNPKYNLYAFRHMAISDLVNATNDIEFAAKQAGNSPELALKHYLHRKDSHYQALIKKAEKPQE